MWGLCGWRRFNGMSNFGRDTGQGKADRPVCLLGQAVTLCDGMRKDRRRDDRSCRCCCFCGSSCSLLTMAGRYNVWCRGDGDISGRDLYNVVAVWNSIMEFTDVLQLILELCVTLSL